MVSFRMAKETLAKLRLIATSEDTTVARLIRRFVTECIARKGGPSPKTLSLAKAVGEDEDMQREFVKAVSRASTIFRALDDLKFFGKVQKPTTRSGRPRKKKL